MATKDPHIAYIDAHEELHQIKMKVKAAVALVQRRAVAGLPLGADDKAIIEAIRQSAVDATRRIQDRLNEELESHG